MSDQFNWFFKHDRYAVMKTFREDDSIIYRLSTIGAETSWVTNWLVPACKANFIFFKVQLPTYRKAYDALEAEGVNLDPDCRDGLKNTISGMTGQYLDVIEHTQGSQIKRFCEKHEDDVAIAKEEIGHMRIFLITWAPQAKDRPNNKLRLTWGKDGNKNMKRFMGQEFKGQLTVAEWESYLRKPIKWTIKNAAVFFAGAASSVSPKTKGHTLTSCYRS